MTDRKPLALVVEDDEPTAETLAEMLRNSGVDVLRALNVVEARALPARDGT